MGSDALIGRDALIDAIAASRGDRRVLIDTIGAAIAALLPLEYRGVYGRDAHT